ncbi:MAG: hypothetical protein STHCBS139747_006944 [Sporothrix thermara]
MSAVNTGEGATANATAAMSPSPSTPPTVKASLASAPEAMALPPATPPSKTSNSKLASDGAQPDVSVDPLGELAVSKVSASPKKPARRTKKKLPWKGKSIMVLLPLDEQRGKAGKAPKPLTEADVTNMLHSWEELGYDIRGFDLDRSVSPNDYDYHDLSSRSMSRPSWPDENDVVRERAEQKYPIRLPDLNAWKNYVDELNEAKLRALGVSFGDDEPPLPPSISPGVGASISRQSSATVYPPLPFSPPIPTSSASSNHGAPPFTFPAAFIPGSGGTQSPSLMSTASPIPFGHNAKYTRQSISIPAGMFQLPPLQQTTPGGFSPQALMLQHGLVRGGSPSLAALSSVMSPTSPFTPDGSFTSPPIHQRHQSLQYPLMQYPQLQTSARASPRLQDLREIEEEVEEQPIANVQSKTTETAPSQPFIQHNASLSLQNEIDAAEYHLEEQFRSQFEHDRDYSPHGGKDVSDPFSSNAAAQPMASVHDRGLSVQFAPPLPIQRFRDDAENSPTMHHPRPHSRGHSLANAYYVEHDENRIGANQGSFTQDTLPTIASAKALSQTTNVNNSYEVETNPSNLGTPVQNLDFNSVLRQQNDQQKQMHQRAFSTTSNPWGEGASFTGKPSSTHLPSHGSKASLSNLNVEAPEFKFNPGATSTYQPIMANQFTFGGNGIKPSSEPFQPSIFQAGLAPNAPLSANSSQFSLPATGPSLSKISVKAPTFSPGQSEFSFSAAGPKFRPDAPAFTPLHTFSDSITSPVQSVGEGSINGANRTSTIFGNIDLNLPDVVKPAKRSKAVPIVRPSSGHKDVNEGEGKENETQYDREGRVIDDSRVKRARATPMDGGNEEVLFAKPSDSHLPVVSATPEPSSNVATVENVGKAEDDVEDKPERQPEEKNGDKVLVEDSAAEDKNGPGSATPQAEADANVSSEASDDAAKTQDETEKPINDEGESALAAEDSTLSSTVLSESTDAAKVPATASPSELSPAGSIPWVPFEFRSDVDIADFNGARPMGEGIFGHKKSLSATAKPFTPGASLQGNISGDFADDFVPFAEIIPTTELPEEKQDTSAPFAASPGEATRFSSPPPPPPPASDKPKSKGLAASRYAAASPPPPPPPKPQTLPSSRFATSSPPPVPSKDTEPGARKLEHAPEQQLVMPVPESDFNQQVATNKEVLKANAGAKHEPTFEEIDDIMLYLNEFDPAQGVNKASDSAPWHQPGPTSTLPAPDSALSYQRRAPQRSPSPPLFGAHGVPHQRRANNDSVPPSEWEGDFAGDESLKLESRVKFFDGHVNDIVGGILSARLGPLEATLDSIQHAIASMSRGTPPSRRERRSVSGDIQESDADDEDDDLPPVPRRSMSPRRDRRMEQMRAVVLEALNSHQSNPLFTPAVSSATLAAVDLSGEAQKKSDALQARIAELEERLQAEQAKTEREVSDRRAAEDKAAELLRKLELAEAKMDVEATNRSVYDQRVSDLDDRLRHETERAKAELTARNAAEDRIAEVQRLLRISSDEETRLREAVDDRDKKLKELNDTRDESQSRLAALEASQINSQKTCSDLQARVDAADSELREKTQEARHWRAEAERAIDLSQRQGNDLVQTAMELRHVKKAVDILGTQLEENERLRDTWRTKFVALQEDMARAAREVAEESARHIKREQTLIARHEVLNAKLQAEARTRERLESELERLEGGERQAMRAVAECKRLEALVGELRTENHKLQQSSLRYQTEFEEARESAAREIQRTRDSMQSEIDGANHQVNVVRSELEDQIARMRSQLDQVKLDADTSKARLEMLLEEAETTKRSSLEAAEAAKRRSLEEMERRHQNKVEDLEARYERQISNANEDAQRAEQNLLERLSISTSKTEHLQDRVAHLEEKLEIAREAAQAAAKAAKAGTTGTAGTAGTTGTIGTAADVAEIGSAVSSRLSALVQPVVAVKATASGLGLPEKISPQALRESILVLQEQLQQREHRIEELEQTLEKLDPDAQVKIAKRDDEIVWLRELLAVRHSDLKDIITALGREEHDPDRVRDAVIRLQANLQMEEQERERAMNGGSAINLPTIAASIRDAATPRVAQAVGPLAAAWGSWRKARDSNVGSTLSSLSGALLSSSSSSPAPAAASRKKAPSSSLTPARAASSSVSSRTSHTSRAGPVEPQSGDSSFLSGLMTPPLSGMRQTPQSRQTQPQGQQEQQPTAFSSTGRRYAGEQAGSRRTSRADKEPIARDMASTPPSPAFRRASRGEPVTPPMMHTSAYDSDAQADEFDDAAFFDD